MNIGLVQSVLYFVWVIPFWSFVTNYSNLWYFYMNRELCTMMSVFFWATSFGTFFSISWNFTINNFFQKVRNQFSKIWHFYKNWKNRILEGGRPAGRRCCQRVMWRLSRQWIGALRQLLQRQMELAVGQQTRFAWRLLWRWVVNLKRPSATVV